MNQFSAFRVDTCKSTLIISRLPKVPQRQFADFACPFPESISMKSSFSYPSGPKGSLLLGNLPDIRREQMRFLLRCARDYGDFVPLRLGPKRAFLLNHPD